MDNSVVINSVIKVQVRRKKGENWDNCSGIIIKMI